MTKLEKLIMAKQQIENIQNLMRGNDWEGFINQRLVSVWYELDRQESLLKPVCEVAQGDGTAP